MRGNTGFNKTGNTPKRCLAVLLALAMVLSTLVAFSPSKKVQAADAAETWIYINGQSGDDSKDGTSEGNAVKTWAKAKELLGCAAGGIYVVGTVEASGVISTKDPSNQKVKRTSDIVMFHVAGGLTAEFININVDGEDKEYDSEVIHPDSGATINFFEGAKFQRIGYLEDVEGNRWFPSDWADDGSNSKRPISTKGGRVCSLQENVTININGAEFVNNKGKGIFWTPWTGNYGGGYTNVTLTMWKGTVTGNWGHFYFNENETQSNKVLIYNALVTGNDTTYSSQRYDRPVATSAVHVCNAGTILVRNADGAAIFGNSQHDIEQESEFGDGQKLKIAGSYSYEYPGVAYNKMLGGGTPNWNFGTWDDPATLYVPDIDYYEAHPTDEDIAKARGAAESIFEGNKSVVFDSNGSIQFGHYENENKITPPVTPTVEQGCDDTPPTPPTPPTPGPSGASVTIKASKTMDGEVPAAEQFSFQLLKGTEVIETVKNDADGNVTFSALTFNAAGTYTYTVKEVIPADAVNNVKDGIEYDNTEHTVVVVVDDQCTITSVTVDNNQIALESGSASTNNLGDSVTFKGETIQGADTKNVYYFPSNGQVYTTQTADGSWDLIKAVEDNNAIAFCIDDGIASPTGEYQHNKIDLSQADDLDDNTLKKIKKLFYFGAPFDGGNGEIVKWIVDQNLGYSEAEAKNVLAYVTTETLKDITNASQGVTQVEPVPGFIIPLEKKVLGEIIDPDTGEFIYDAADRVQSGYTTVFDMVAQMLWKKVLDGNTDNVTDLVNLTVYSATGNPNRVEGNKQRIITAEIQPTSSATVSVAFANTTEQAPETVNVTVTKKWYDTDGTTIIDAPAGGKARFQVYADGEAVTGQVANVNASNNWTFTFTNLPKYRADGTTAIVYTIEEVEFNGTGFTAGNIERVSETEWVFEAGNVKKAPETISITVNKKWVDTDGTTTVDAPAGGKARFQVYADGEAVTGQVANVNASNNWTFTFTNLPKYKADGTTEIVYTVDEIDFVGGGFTRGEVTGSVTDGFTVTNKKEQAPETISITVTKEWVNFKASEAPEVSVQLKKDGTAEGEAVKLNAGNNWTYTWTELLLGPEYIVEETDVDASKFESKTTGNAENGFTITNKNIETVDISGTKTWVDGGKTHDNAAEVILTLKRISAKEGVEEETANATPVWNGNTYKFTGLPLYDAEGYAYTYSVSEAEIDGYDTTQDGNNFINTITGTTDVSGTKTWVDGGKTHDNAAEVTLTLKRISAKEGAEEETANATPVWNGNTYKFTDLPLYDAEGYEYTYSVSEAEIEGYTTTQNGNSFTNTITGTTDVEVKKVWDDSNNQDGKRPASVNVKLFADNVDTGKTLELSESNNWTGSFTGLDKYKDGVEIVYTVDEVAVPAYTKKVDNNSFTITNSYTPGKTQVDVRKVWEGDLEEFRPESITVKLVADGKETGDVLTLSKANSWTGSFTGLDAMKDGKDIVYTVVEEEVEAYKSSLSGDAEQGFILTNTYVPEDQTVKIRKVDMVNGQEVAGAEIEIFDEEGKSIGTWTSEEGKAIELSLKPGDYTFKEVNAPEGYICVTTEIGFSVDLKGNITVKDVNVQPAGAVEVVNGEIILKDELMSHTVKVNKTNLGGEEVDGARVVVRDSNKKVKATWTSKIGKTMDLELKPGQYILTEVNAPVGYECVTTEILFTVDKAGNITVDEVTVEPAGAVEVKDGIIILKNALTHYPVILNKTDVGGTELDGAEIKVWDADGNLVGEWTSEKGKTMEMYLQPGDYTFEEVNAPKDHQRVETTIGFTVEMDGTITITTTDVEPAGAVEVVDGTIVLKDELAEGEKEETSSADAIEEEETEETEEDGEGQIPHGGDEEGDTVDAETESPETEPGTEPEGTLPYAEEEESTTVDAENETPGSESSGSSDAATTTASAPDTGDHSNLGLYLGLMAVAALGGFGLLVGTRKKEEA